MIYQVVFGWIQYVTALSDLKQTEYWIVVTWCAVLICGITEKMCKNMVYYHIQMGQEYQLDFYTQHSLDLLNMSKM